MRKDFQDLMTPYLNFLGTQQLSLLGLYCTKHTIVQNSIVCIVQNTLLECKICINCRVKLTIS